MTIETISLMVSLFCVSVSMGASITMAFYELFELICRKEDSRLFSLLAYSFWSGLMVVATYLISNSLAELI